MVELNAETAYANTAGGARLRKPRANRCDKLLLIVAEDWFALSHFKPLIRALAAIAGEVIIATRVSDRAPELVALGLKVVDFDFARSSLDPLRQAQVVRRLSGLIKDIRPDAVHVVALQMMVTTALALEIAPVPHAVFHLTGLGYLGTNSGPATTVVRHLALRAIGRSLRRPNTWLMAENPDDCAVLKAAGADPGHRVTLLGGAGIDPEQFQPVPEPVAEPPVAAYVGRMIQSKGVEVLAQAARRLKAEGFPLTIRLYGSSDSGNRKAIPPETIRAWEAEGLVNWYGHVADVSAIWRDAHFAVLPSHAEGLPRALLEAGACGRPAVTTDVPGCRHLIRDGREGLVVAPGDAGALAGAMRRLGEDARLRSRLGLALRARVLLGYTETSVIEAVLNTYFRVLG